MYAYKKLKEAMTAKGSTYLNKLYYKRNNMHFAKNIT